MERALPLQRRVSVLIVEDEALIAADLADALQQQGYDIVGVVATAEQALRTIEATPPALALLDIHLRSKRDGIHVAEALQRQGIPFVFLTANSDPSTLARAEATEPAGYLVKPFDERTLYATVRMALYRSRAEREREQRRAMLVSAVDRIDRPVIGLGADARVRWANAPATDLGVQGGMTLIQALSGIGRPEIEPQVSAAVSAPTIRELDGETFQLVAAARGYVLVVGRAPEAPLCLCAWCQKARGDDGTWDSVEGVLQQRYGIDLTHGICGDCVDSHFGDLDPG